MHSDYRSPVLRQLRDQQVRFAPRDKKVEQADRAEKLLNELEMKRSYPYEYLAYRITDFRPETTPHTLITGDEARHDLGLFVEDVSDAADVPVEDAGEPVHTVEDLSRMFHVSTKTISRWRQQGLVSRRFVFDGRKRVVDDAHLVDLSMAPSDLPSAPGNLRRSLAFNPTFWVGNGSQIEKRLADALK